MTIRIEIEAVNVDDLRAKLEGFVNILFPPTRGFDEPVPGVYETMSVSDLVKNVQPASTPIMDALQEGKTDEEAPKRGRGRPRKDSNTSAVLDTSAKDDTGQLQSSQSENDAENDPSEPASDEVAYPRTYEETRAKLMELSQKKTAPYAMAFLKEHGGVPKLGEMKQEAFGAFYAKLVEELAK